jgi:hypothetical protein
MYSLLQPNILNVRKKIRFVWSKDNKVFLRLLSNAL